ncbi:Efflux pump dotC [Colletotrichum sp. SAR11_59]|nr:Efflux pump dotC [Colletotrichum sp. SAR11_59]
MVVFATLAITLLIAFIDQNGISITLPTIAADLNAEDTISWAGTSSLIANTTFQMLYGRFSDIFGRKAVFLSAIGLLALADLLCGLSRNAAMFYIFRGIAGIGGGGITNLAMIIVSDVVTLEQRGKYQGIIGSMVGLGNVLGPFLAAAFMERATWRAFFYMLSPLGVIVGVICYFFLPSKPPSDDFKSSVKKIDYAGSFTSSLGVILLLIPISGGGAYFPWNSAMVISMLTIGALALVSFIVVEWKFAKLPMMPTAIYVSLVRYGEVIWLGFGFWTLGAGLTLIFDRNTKPGIIVIPLLIVGIGVGFIFQPTLVALQAHSIKSRRAVITSNRNFFRCAGGACGLAISAAILQATLRANLPAEFKYLSSSTYSIPQLSSDDMSRVLDAYMAASRAVFILQIPLVGLCLVGCLLIKDRGLEPIDDTKPEDTSSESRDEEEGVSREKTSNRDGENGDSDLPADPTAQTTTQPTDTMAKIKSVRYYRVKPRWLMVKITDENGEYGWGEATLEGHDLAVEGTLEEMIPRIVGLEANNIEHIWQLFWRHGFYRGGPVFMSAMSGIDIALWDLKGRNLKVPIYELLGGQVRNKVQVYCWIGGDRPSDVEAAAKKRIEQGLTCVKMNATEDLNWVDSPKVLNATVERLRQVKALGLDAGLDFHGRLHKAMAKQLARALEPLQPLFIEEPLLCEHPEAIKQLADQTTIPIAFGERLYTRWDIKRFLEDASVDILQPDIAHAGGISETKKIATMAEAYDVAIAPHCPLGPVAFAASVQVALSSPNFSILEMSLGMHYNTEAGDIDLLTYLKNPTVFDIEGGYVKAPTGYGLGIDIDEEMVEKIAKETEPWQCKVFHGPDGSIREW